MECHCKWSVLPTSTATLAEGNDHEEEKLTSCCCTVRAANRTSFNIKSIISYVIYKNNF